MTQSVGLSLDLRERLALFNDSGLSREYILSLQLVTYDLMREYCKDCTCIKSAQLSIGKLRRMGAETADHIRVLGFDAIDLRDESFCVQMINEWGEEAVQKTFVNNAASVHKIAGSSAMHVLRLTPNWMLSECKQEPVFALRTLRAMIDNIGLESTMSQISMPTLIETNLHSVELTRLGITVDVLTSCMHATSEDLRVLNYTFRMQ
jgi:hypothetical protein